MNTKEKAMIFYWTFQAKMLLYRVGVNRETAAQGLIEYALIILLIALAVIGTLLLLGGQVTAMYQTISNGVPAP